MNKAKNAKKTMLPAKGFATPAQFFVGHYSLENIKLRHSFRDYTDIKEGVRLFSGEQAS